MLGGANRDAKELFVEEFSAVLGRISSMPELGQRYRRTRGKLIQRMLMKKTRCHVYYFHDQEQGVIEVHSVWGGCKKRGPKQAFRLRHPAFGLTDGDHFSATHVYFGLDNDVRGHGQVGAIQPPLTPIARARTDAVLRFRTKRG